jgi:quercetin dioxygenase-like cupin family protein
VFLEGANETARLTITVSELCQNYVVRGLMTADPRETSELQGVIGQSGLVEYQSGSVVSRTLIKKSAGTVTAFAFDAGEGLSEHTAPYDALVLGIDGEAEISIAGVVHRVSVGQLLKLPAGQPHAVRAITPFKMLLVMIRA